jgi:hypothetical protein
VPLFFTFLLIIASVMGPGIRIHLIRSVSGPFPELFTLFVLTGTGRNRIAGLK